MNGVEPPSLSVGIVSYHIVSYDEYSNEIHPSSSIDANADANADANHPYTIHPSIHQSHTPPLHTHTVKKEKRKKKRAIHFFLLFQSQTNKQRLIHPGYQSIMPHPFLSLSLSLPSQTNTHTRSLSHSIEMSYPETLLSSLALATSASSALRRGDAGFRGAGEMKRLPLRMSGCGCGWNCESCSFYVWGLVWRRRVDWDTGFVLVW